jgi:hypothetical protein
LGRRLAFGLPLGFIPANILPLSLRLAFGIKILVNIHLTLQIHLSERDGID